MTIWTLLFSTAAICFLDHGFARADSHYVNEWAAEIPGGLDRATRVAEEHGYRLVREGSNQYKSNSGRKWFKCTDFQTIGTDTIGTGTIGTGTIGTGTFGTGTIGTGTIGTGTIGTGTIGTGTIGTGTIGTGTFGTGTIGTGTIGAGTIGAGTIGAGTIGAGTIGAGTVGTGTIGTGTIGTGTFGTGTIGTGTIGTGTIGTGTIGAGTIGAGTTGTGTIGTGTIGTGTIGTGTVGTERSDVPHRSRRSADHHTKRLSEDDRVLYVEQQVELSRAKRDLTDRDIARRLIITGHATKDPDLSHEWYIFNTEYVPDRRDGVRADMGVVQVWQQNITGKGSVVTILDDGVEGNHSDLAANYDPQASYDFNGNDPDPSPRYDPTNENKHGTRCAGEIAMVANNNKCGVGIAFDCKIGGIRMLDGRVTDRMEGDALAYNIDHVHIYSASWGPTDDGKTVEGPGRMASQGLEKGIREGRNGKGSLYVWASGNGGTVGDNCNADGYTSSIYTMSISTTTQNGNSPWYAEKCASTIASTYSSGTSSEGKVTSADLHDLCTHDHTGTSAAAPMAAGIIALVLEANPDLTWRDMQHLVIQSARPEPLLLQGGWYINGAGFCVSLSSGFGLMNAKTMVDLAKTWTPVGEQHKCSVNASLESGFPQTLTPGNFIEVTFTTDGCAGQTNVVNYLEHIQVVFDLEYDVRGKIYAEIESPVGTITPLFLERKNDKSNKGFKNWPLMSVHTWGENPQGKWKFRVADRSKSGTEKGSLKNATLVLYGTAEKPEYQDGVPKCNIINKFIESKNLTDVQIKMNRLQTLLNNNDSIKNPKVQESLNKLLQELEGKDDVNKILGSLEKYSEELHLNSNEKIWEKKSRGFK
ncbi:Neuroendocrine convertase 1 [Bulinus truncatus]|nr:Neuroendocrine convertase 1 [Bulinus truncatus]